MSTTRVAPLAPRLRPSEEGSKLGQIAEWNSSSIRTLLDRATSLVLLIPACPLMFAAAIAMRLTSRGPALYRQVRVGRGGRPFTLYKIRTMIDRCESGTGPVWSGPGDTRVTRVGRFLRRTHLDELPQLWNILRGEMSLVGPRPERPEFIGELERLVPRYRERLAVRPGLSGLAQITLPADTHPDDVRRKLIVDLYYVSHSRPSLDARILLSTGFSLLGVPFGLSRRVLGLPMFEAIEEAGRYAAWPTSARQTGSRTD